MAVLLYLLVCYKKKLLAANIKSILPLGILEIVSIA